MLTRFGKILKNIRMESNEYAKNMADILDVTPAYLSAVEHGKREVPSSWIEMLVRNYSLGCEMENSLREAADEARAIVKINLSGLSNDNKILANAFARKLKIMKSSDVDAMLEILNKMNEEE